MTLQTNRQKVRIFADGYRYYDKILKDYECGISTHSIEYIMETRKDIARIESAVYHLNESDHLIMYHEIILGKTGNWYLEFYSESTYRRKCKVAYANFLRLVEC